MPELPEVQTIVCSLSDCITGRTISSLKVCSQHVLRWTSEYEIKQFRNKRIAGVRRRGKLILITFEKDEILLFHLKMTGQLIFLAKDEPWDRHTHLSIRFRALTEELRFRDVRKFGFLAALRSGEAAMCKELRELGPEPLEIDEQNFLRLFEKRKTRLKSLLLDQTFLAGIGNIYADEILFRARLHPFVSAASLSRGQLQNLRRRIKEVLREAVSRRGSSIRDFSDACGRQGGFQDQHRVYGRESLPCPDCGQTIQRLRLTGRSCFVCPDCQRL